MTLEDYIAVLTDFANIEGHWECEIETSCEPGSSPGIPFYDEDNGRVYI